ncbi:MAG: oligoendopeptidase F, partial [Defluviitaleaceae bacterium]|nr:oligoendopeptidase F [Defluviitaleaceae bacterium]
MEIKLKKRSEIADEFKWRIGDMFVSDDRWQERFDAMKATVQDFGKFRGKLGNAETLVLCLDYMIGAGLETGLLYVYANMKLHEDTNVAKYQGFAGMAQTLYTQLLSAASFVEPEILDNAEAIRRFMDDCEGLKLYGHYLENLLRKKEHILSAEMEKVLADAGEIGAA